MNDPILKMNRAQIKSMQERKLRNFFRYQLPFHPFYRKRFKELNIDFSDIRTVRDLQKIPLTVKKDIAPDKEDPARYKKFVLQPTLELIKKTWPKGKLIKLAASKAAGKDVQRMIKEEYTPIHLIATSGTTGANTPFVYSKYDMELFGDSYVRAGNLVGLTPGIRVMNLFPFAPHLAFYFALMAGWRGGWFMYHSGGGAVTPTTKSIELVKRLESEALAGIPSYIYHFCRKAVESGERITTLKKILTAGERFPDALKFKIESLCAELGSPDVKIHDVYGTTEMRTACPECRPHTDAFHVHPDLFIHELVDPDTGEQVAEGEKGILAVTSIDGRGTILVRYLIGDIFEKGYDTDRCPDCGTFIPRLVGPVGRMKDYDEHIQLTKVKGTLINLYQFHDILPAIKNLAEWQVVLSKKDNDPYEVDVLTVNISPKGGSDIEGLVKDIRDRIHSLMELTPKVEIFHNCDNLFDLMGGQVKPKRILDERPDIEGQATAPAPEKVKAPKGEKLAH